MTSAFVTARERYTYDCVDAHPGRRGRVERSAGVLAAAAASTALVVHHSDPWVGPLGRAGTAVFLLVVAVCFVPYAARRVRGRGRLTVGLLLVPVIAVVAVVTAAGGVAVVPQRGRLRPGRPGPARGVADPSV